MKLSSTALLLIMFSALCSLTNAPSHTPPTSPHHTSQQPANPPASVGYDPLFSSGITYEEQRLRAGSFHTEQQRARANSLMMDNMSQFRPQGDAWQVPATTTACHGVHASSH